MNGWLVWCDDCERVVYRSIYLGDATARAERHCQNYGHIAYVDEEELS